MDLLLVEDEVRFAAPLITGLTREGYGVQHVMSGRAAIEAPTPDLVLLDLNLPDMDGMDVARSLREEVAVPIIIITARREEVDVVLGLELGADDYITKPFSIRQLTARIRAVMRRSRPEDDVARQPPVVVGDLAIDLAGRSVRLADDNVHVTPLEFDLLALLASQPGVVVGRDEIIHRIWGDAWFGTTKTIDVHVAALRRKLGAAGWIRAVRGRGFKLVPPE